MRYSDPHQPPGRGDYGAPPARVRHDAPQGPGCDQESGYEPAPEPGTCPAPSERNGSGIAAMVCAGVFMLSEVVVRFVELGSEVRMEEFRSIAQIAPAMVWVRVALCLAAIVCGAIGMRRHHRPRAAAIGGLAIGVLALVHVLGSLGLYWFSLAPF